MTTPTPCDLLAAIIADAICGEKPSYSPDQACTAHRMQAEGAADAVVASPAIDALVAERVAALADEWTQGEWANHLVTASDPAAIRIGSAQRFGDWLRQRAAALTERRPSNPDSHEWLGMDR